MFWLGFPPTPNPLYKMLGPRRPWAMGLTMFAGSGVSGESLRCLVTPCPAPITPPPLTNPPDLQTSSPPVAWGSHWRRPHSYLYITPSHKVECSCRVVLGVCDWWYCLVVGEGVTLKNINYLKLRVPKCEERFWMICKIGIEVITWSGFVHTSTFVIISQSTFLS